MSNGLDLGDMAESLSFHLKRTDSLVFQHFTRRIPRHHLLRGEVAILTLVAANPGLNHATLSRAVGLDTSTISSAIRKLSERGLLEQRPTHDRRVRELYLTAAGRFFARSMEPQLELHELEIAAALQPQERQQLIALLQRVFDAVSAIEAGPGAPPDDGE